MLATLALAVGHRASEATLIDAVWGEEPPRTATKTLQTYVARLRQTVGDAVEPWAGGGRGYSLRGEVDATDVERLADQARVAGTEAAVALYDEALALWDGEPLADCVATPWIQAQAGRLEELRLTLAKRVSTCASRRAGTAT